MLQYFQMKQNKSLYPNQRFIIITSLRWVSGLRPAKLFKLIYYSHIFDDFLTLIFQLWDIKIRSNKCIHQIDIK
jgi:hypothetical protein